MKKTLIILILVLAYQFTNAQVKVLGKIEPNGATDKYPTHIDSLGRGGLMTAASWQERNAIPAERRKAGMLVRVKSASVDSTYTLGVGLTNADWVPFVAVADVVGKEDRSNKVVSLTSPDHITYPTTQAVATGLATKPNTADLSTMLVDLTTNQTIGGTKLFTNFPRIEAGNLYRIPYFSTGGYLTQSNNFTFNAGVNQFNAPSLNLSVEPTTSAFTYDILTRNTSSGMVEKVSSNTFASGSALTSKANLAGGNTFNGNQFVNGEFKVYNPDEFMYEGKMFMDSDVFNIVTPYNLKISGGSETQFVTDFLNASIAETRFTGNVGIGMMPVSEKLEVNGNAIFTGSITADSPKFTGEGTFTSEDGFIFKHPDPESTNYAYVNYSQLGFIGNGGSATFGTGQIASNVFNAAAKNNAFLVNLGEDVPTLSLIQDNIGNTIKPNLLGGNVTTTLPAVTGTLVTMEQVLAMTAVQTAAYHAADISGTTVTVATSPSRYKKLYIYKPSEIGSPTVFKMPANPTIGDLVEIISIASGDAFPSHYIEIQNSAGTFISYGTSRLMAYRWNGTTWVDESTD